MTTEDTAVFPIDTLKEDPVNPRAIGQDALDGLSGSLSEFGDLSGIVFNETTGQLVAGHQRLKALRQAGATEWIREGGTGCITHPQTGEVFPIRIVSWSLDRQRMANLVANNQHIQGEFTEAALEQLRALDNEALKEALKLLSLETSLAEKFRPPDWNSDIDDITRHGENVDGIEGRIVVRCPQEMKGALTAALRNAIDAGGFDGVQID
jgi:hypothetical protein